MLRGIVIKLHPNFAQSRFKQYFVTKRISRLSLERRKGQKDKLLDELMGKPVQKEENAPNPSVAKTEKSPQSEPTSEQPKKSAEGATMTKEKPSVREELRKIKESRKEQKAEVGTSALDKSGASDRAKSANGKTEHKQPQRKKKKPKSKETRIWA